MSSKSREMIKKLIPDVSSIEGSVVLPTTFQDTIGISSYGIDDVIFEKMRMVREGQKTGLTRDQSKELKDKITKTLINFYIENFDLMNEIEMSGLNRFLVDAIIQVDMFKEVVPQYAGFKAKFAGILFGFFINHSVRQQNQLNARYAVVAAEFRKIAEERASLGAQLMCATAKLEALEAKLGGKA